MKNNISLKRTLLATLPCLVLSLVAVSCSDDDSAVLTDKATKGKTITFATGAPVITDYSTRVGLNESNLTPTGDEKETLIWHDGDGLTFNFIKYGETVGQVYPYTISPVGPSRYEITTDSEMNISNGLYEVHVVSPGLEPGVKTFTGGDVTATTIDLKDQYQPAIMNNYKNLGDYYYQYAYTLLKVEDNEIAQGSNFIEFTALTSLIRYRINNNLGEIVHVAKINVSYDDISESPFYTRGTFDPLTDIAIQPVGEPVSTLGLRTDKTLVNGTNFNAFLSLIPTAANNPAADITYTVFFYIDGHGSQLYKKVFKTTAVNLANGNLTAGGRWLQGLTLQGAYDTAIPSELDDEEEGPITPPVIQPESVTITSNSSINELEIDETLTLSATINPSGAIGTIVWSSSDDGIAVVDENGVVTGVSAGEANITATVVGADPVVKAEVTVPVNAKGVRTETIDGQDYKTYTFNDGTGVVTWFIDPLRDSDNNVIYASPHYDCPSPYTYPGEPEVMNLCHHLKYNDIMSRLFFDRAPDVVAKHPQYGDSNKHLTMSGLSFLSNATANSGQGVYYIGFSINSDYYVSTQGFNVEYRYLVRCVKK